MTIVDPRHPLSGLTLPLVQIIDTLAHPASCVVLWSDQKRYVPLAVTDRGIDPLIFYPHPLDISSVKQLVATYELIQSQLEESTEDGADTRGAIPLSKQLSPSDANEGTETGLDSPGVGVINPTSTTTGLSNSHQHWRSVVAPNGSPPPQPGGHQQ